MKVLSYFVACCLFFGSAVADEGLFCPQCSVVVDSSKVCFDLPSGWIATDSPPEELEGLLPKDMPFGPPVTFQLEKLDDETEFAIVVLFPCGEKEVAQHAIRELKSYFPPKESFEDGFNVDLGEELIAYKAYGSNLVMTIYVPDKANREIGVIWQKLQRAVILRPVEANNF